MKEILKKLKACDQAIEWVGDRTIEQAIQECERGDWMLWLFKELFPDDLQLLTLAKGHSANTVRHLMSEVSIKAVDTSIAFGEGRVTREELDAAGFAAGFAAAYAAAADAGYAADYAADYAAYAAAADAGYAADYAAYAAYAAADYAAAADAAADAGYAARKENHLQTADICRKHIGEKLIEGCNEIKEVNND
jgi:hypothetical protein